MDVKYYDALASGFGTQRHLHGPWIESNIN